MTKRGDTINTKRKGQWARLLSAALVCVLAFAGEPAAGTCRDVMFLLDMSQSMNDTDPQRVAPDAVRGMIGALGPTDRAGVLEFDTSVRNLHPLSSAWGNGLPDLSRDAFEGYTNTGEAVMRALQTLEPGGASEKAVILLTDGEIMMPDAEETLHSAQMFAEGMEKASQSGIPVYILSIQNGPDDADYKIYTGYAKDETVPIEKLLMMSRELVRREFGTQSMELSPTFGKDGAGRITGISAKLPVTEAEGGVRVVITASTAGRAASPGQPLPEAQRVHVIGKAQLTDGRLEFSADYPPGTEIKLDAVPMLEGTLRAEAELAVWGRGGKLRVTPVVRSDENRKLLGDKYFDGKKVHLQVNGEKVEGILKNGTITAPLPESEGAADFATVEGICFEELGIRYLGTNSAKVPLERGGRWPMYAALFGIGIIALLLWLLRGKKRKREEHAVLPPAGKVLNPQTSYSGKLVLYITKTPDDTDLPPLEFNLFRQSRGKEITVEEVLKGCGVMLKFPGAEQIVLGPVRRGIYVRNESDCTVTKRGNIILKHGTTELGSDERLHIAFADEVSEMIMIYKDLKPERG